MADLALSVRTLRQEASLAAGEVTELADATGGRPATLYRFLDGSVGYMAPEAPYWQEAGELNGKGLRRAMAILEHPGESTLSPGR